MENNIEEKAVELTKTNKGWLVNSKTLSKFNCPGIWVLYGQKKDSNEIECLEVGQVADVTDEICRDIGLLTRDYDYTKPKTGTRKKMFSNVDGWCEQLDASEKNRDLDKYKTISAKYDYLYFDVYTNEDEYKDKFNRTEKEIDLFLTKKAKYWYGNNWDNEVTRALEKAKEIYPDMFK